MGRTSGKKDLTDNDKRAIVVGRQNGLTMMTLAGMFGVTEACISQVKWAKEHLNWTRQDWNKILWSDESKFLLFGSDGIQWNLVPVLTGPVEMLFRPLHPAGSILFRNQRRRFTDQTNGGYGEFKKTSRLIAGAVSLGLVVDVFKMFLSSLRSVTRGLPELRNARLCHAEHSCQRHHGQSILTTHNDGSFVVISQILFSRGSSHV
ncbi:unnamed protein product [Caenorhabditis auriculariae]|uniref:Tc3 transposase DNA binding domain-containing protein n=1 Tax=Caenorhabditis auriculariae TaxID=2777116 RepID=A0A8S1HN33_9PELO|nr:unnamed protein product [Caenorhabditis auriculariae]